MTSQNKKDELDYNFLLKTYPTGEDLKKMRESIGLSLNKAADMSGLSNNTILRVEEDSTSAFVYSVVSMLGMYQILELEAKESIVPDPFGFVLLTGDELMELREGLGLTREEMAKKADVTPGTIRNIELRPCSPRGSTYRKITDTLHGIIMGET